MKGWQVALSAVVGSIVFLAVLSGTLRATGAAPGGILTGRWAFVASIVSHALSGGLRTWLILFGWSGFAAIIFALVGAIRRKRSWYAPLLWTVSIVLAAAVSRAIEAIQDRLGSASPGVWDGAQTWSPPFWDAGAFWGATAVVGTFLLVTAPLYIKGLWRWSNGGSFGDGLVWFRVPVYTAYLALASMPFVIVWALGSALFARAP